jgi:hypothetical protein
MKRCGNVTNVILNKFQSERTVRTMKELITHLLVKMASGRWILTVICGVVFAYGVVKKLIPPDASVSIISMVFISYFNKNTDNKGETK